MRILLACLALAACASTAELEASPAASPAPVIAAERAFAADAAARGWAAAFRSYAASEAVMLNPGPVNAQEQLAQIEGDGGTGLDWRPAYAGISRDADFGFTTGPFQIRGREGIVGHYFTVWRRQPDGGWKWIFDAGTDVADPGPIIAMDADIPTLPVTLESAGSARAAIEQVSAIETQVATGGALPNEALARHLAEDARVNRVGAPAGIGREAGAALIAADRGVGYMSVSHEASSAGDMVFSFGEVRDQHEGAERLRYYARIWQRRPEGWRIVFDEIVPHRGQ
jgi:ketosteroid isomerase-like protein